jgi:hypothetical protein
MPSLYHRAMMRVIESKILRGCLKSKKCRPNRPPAPKFGGAEVQVPQNIACGIPERGI